MAYLDSSNVEDLVADIKELADQTYATPSDIPSPGTGTPEVVGGTGSAGSSSDYARADHKHPLGTIYGRCDTAADVAAKTVSITNFRNVQGEVIYIFFTNPNSASNPTLNVNNTGAFPIYAYSSVAADNSNLNGWPRSSVVALIRRSDSWFIIGKSGEPYNSMTVAEADAGTSNDNRVIAPSTLKHAINYFAPPYEHASATTQYGAGSANNYGHLKLSDAVNSNSGVSGAIAATPAAVKAAYDLANGKQDPIGFDTAPTKNSTNAVTSGGVYSVMPGRADETGMITSEMWTAIEASFNSASNYSLFSGTTTSGTEGGWYGFKHVSTKWASAILFVRNYTYIIKRSTSGTWTAYPLI